jgi:uncharacterized membrane protein HdeD (DUF308 family)
MMASTPGDDVRGVRRWLRLTGGLALLAGLVSLSVAVLTVDAVTAMLKLGDGRAAFVATTGTLAMLLGLVSIAEVSGPAAGVLGLVGGVGLVVYGIAALTTVVGPRSAAGR